MADQTLLDSGAAPTRRDDSNATRRDDGAAPQPLRSLFNLPSALASRYRTVEALPTAGAEAEILVIESLETAERVVAKLYRPGIEPKTAVLERVSRIAPEHVVKLIEHGCSDGLWYELLEYCRFGSLRRFLRGRPIPPKYVERIFTEVFRALAHLHESGIIHRDMKPENVLIRTTEPLDLVLTDFGIASLADVSQHFTSASRTVKYGAPEAASGVIGASADYWSLGMMLVEALTGRHPFEGLSEPVINQRLATRPVDVSAVTDERWRLLCRGLLHRNPDERWGADPVDRWLSGDTALSAAADEALAPRGALSPYTIDGDSCTSARELGIALVKHWKTGVKDLARGFVAAWVRDELKDMNLSRFLMDLADDTRLNPDVRLLRVVLRLVPGLPAIWRGEPLDRGNLLAMATKAAAGDDAAAKWINELVDLDIAGSYAAAGDTALGSLAGEWAAKAGEVMGHVEKLRAAEKAAGDERAAASDHADMDELMFGNVGVKAAPAPTLHAEVLKLVLGQSYEAPLRSAVLEQSLEVAADCPWFEALGPIDGLDGAQLVAMKVTAPRAHAWVKSVRERRAREEQRERGAVKNLAGRLERLLAEMRMMEEADFSSQDGDSRMLLSNCLMAFRALDAEASSVSTATDEGKSFRNALARTRMVVNDIDTQLHNMSVWIVRISTNGGGPFAFFIMLAFIFHSAWLVAIGMLIAIGASIWFGWQRWTANYKLRALLRRLPRGTRTRGFENNLAA